MQLNEQAANTNHLPTDLQRQKTQYGISKNYHQHKLNTPSYFPLRTFKSLLYFNFGVVRLIG